jgi:predicted enzyme related to lactoylglutathione lyase
VVHFALYADDIARARRFYQAVLGWSFADTGLPEPTLDIAFPSESGDPAVQGHLATRFLAGPRVTGFECTVEVESAEAVAQLVVAHGGKILLEGHFVPGIGQLIRFEDPEGNVVTAMQYDYETTLDAGAAER